MALKGSLNHKVKQMQETQTKQQYMRAKEVAKYLGIGLSTVWFMAKHGKLKAIKLTERVTVFSKDEIDSLINSAKVGLNG